MIVPYRVFLADHAGSPQDEFLKRITDPHLLVQSSYLAEKKEARESFGFSTAEVDCCDDTMVFKYDPKDLARARGRVFGILPVTKRLEANTFGMMITAGRAENNDLVLKDPRISKFHGYFRCLGTQWTLSDAGSKNGTAVEGILVARERSVNLRSGSRIQLAGIFDFQFLLPEDLYVKLQEQPADAV